MDEQTNDEQGIEGQSIEGQVADTQTKLQEYLEAALDFVVTFTPKVILAIITLWIGFWLVKRVLKILNITFEKSGLSLEVQRFMESFASIILKMGVVLFAASFLGFEVASIIGLLAAASFAVAFALQGSLANLASGLLVMIFRPYKIGDMVEVNGKFGKVEDIKIFSTILGTPGLKTLIIPNSKVTEDTITNFSEKGNIRLEINISMPYAESFPKVKEVILSTLKDISVVLQDPAPEVGIETFDSHSIVLTVRPYVKPDDYWEGTFETHRLLKAAFSRNNIGVAYSEGIELGPIGG